MTITLYLHYLYTNQNTHNIITSIHYLTLKPKPYELITFVQSTNAVNTAVKLYKFIEHSQKSTSKS